MEFKTKLKKFDNSMWTAYLPIPSTFTPILLEKKMKRVFCTLNQKNTFQAGVMSMKGGMKYIMISKARMVKFKLNFDAIINVNITKDTSKYGMELPEVFKVFLDQDSEFNTLFHKLTPGKQRSLLYIVLSTKKEEKQIEKTSVIVNHLKKLNGLIDYKILNQDFKEFTQNNKLL